MNLADWIGATGVSILLLAFLLNLLDRISQSNLIYLLMNLIGAGLACTASVLINYTPFIVLEASWTLVSAVGIMKWMKDRK
ncbi:MAG: hypothetical protein JSS79_11880 [Bacteroidetes bacterium]|nr:hypothetical protein [Bacteroidota bacterium]